MASRFWILSNEDSRAALFRKTFVENNIGSWSYRPGSGWTWKTEIIEVKEETKTETIEINETEEDTTFVKSLKKRIWKTKKYE